MFRLTVVAAILCLVYGQTKFCCFPVQWTGAQGATTGSADDEGHTALTVGNAAVTYDVTGQRFYLSQTLQNGNMSRTYQILQLYKQNVQYIVENGQCTRVALPTYDQATNCIPDNATETGRFMIGRKDNMLVTEYKYSIGQLTTMLIVNDDCVPVVSKSYGQVNGDYLMQGMGFLGLTTGIKDPSVFNVPSICSGAVESQEIGFDGPIFLSPVLK